MNLIIDIGNTLSKYFVFKDDNIIYEYVSEHITISDIEEIQHQFKSLDNVIISSVQELDANYRQFLSSNFSNVVFFNHQTKLPIENLYQTKETLGKDRLAAAVGANAEYRNSNILIIDAGTAITYDFVNDKNQYIGGNISPGLQTRFKALHHFTNQLPLLQCNQSNLLFGTSTHEAITTGVQNGIVYEVDETINAFKDIYANLIIIITGGDADFFDRRLKNSFFVRPNTLALGLNTIFNYNDKKH